MKSNNKLQYLQKLASKNQQQQSGATRKLSQSNNLVGIGQSQGQPYVAGPRFGQKQVKHQPKNASISAVEQVIMKKIPSNKKFTHNKNNASKPTTVVTKDQFNVNIDIKDPRFDQFESIPMALGIFEDDDNIELFRKINRKTQMVRRQQKFLQKGGQSILRIKSKDPTIKFEQVDENESQSEIKIRKQVSISEEPRLGQSPAKDVKLKLNRKLKRNASEDASLQIGQNPKSEFTISSAGKNPEQEGSDNDDDNSIISEVESVFEDQTPAVNKGLKGAPEPSFSLPYGAARVHSPQKSQINKLKNDNLKNDKAIVGNMKTYIKQKTHGWKDQTNHDITRWPFKRSPTNKSRTGESQKFILKVPSDVQKPSGFAQQSRYSSLNYTVDNQMDQISVHDNKNLMFTKGGKDHSMNKLETGSVVSVITKGGSVINPFSQKKNSKIFSMAKSISKSSSIKIGVSARDHKNKTHLMAGEQDLGGFNASKTHVRFGEELDEDLDVRKSYYKNNQKMINIYLKTPYKVLTIDQIKNKEKIDRERDLFDNVNGSPNRLFIAENNLKIHTLIREKNNYATVKGKGFKKSLINVSGDEDNLSNYRSKVQNGFCSTKVKNLMKDGSISQISDGVEFNKNKDLHELESGPNLNSSQDLMSDLNLQQLTSNQLKQLKTQKNQLEIEFKKKFLHQLQSQLVKRIEQVKFQTSVLAKQKNLFAIYGNTTNNNISPDGNHIRSFNNISIETIQAGIDLDDTESNKRISSGLNKYKTATKGGESKLSRDGSPNKYEGSFANSVLKGSISRIQEPQFVKQNTNVSKFSRLSDPEFAKDQLDQDEDDKEHRVSGYSYDFEQEASLKKLLTMSNTLGYSQMQIRELRRKQQELEDAEKQLQKQQMLKGNDFLNSRNIMQNNNSGSFTVLNDKQPKKQPPKFANTRSKTDKKNPIRGKLTSIKEKESKFDERQSVDNEDNVKDYFDNKMSMRRSIEKKMHYEGKTNQKKAAGQNYQTSGQKHQQLLADLKSVKKERAKAYNLHANTQNTGSSYEEVPAPSATPAPVKHLRFKTYDSLQKNGPRSSQQDEKESTLPNIHAQSLRKQKSNVKDSEQQDSLDENFYPLKKSGTQNERQSDVGFSPIRLKRNNVIKAYYANQIQTTNAQYLTAQGQYNAENLMTKNSSSKKQLGFQFMNKSPRPSILSNGLHKESSSFMFDKDSTPQKLNNNTSSSKFILNKQVQLMKGVLSNQSGNPRINRNNLKNKDLMHINEASTGTLPQIYQSSSYAPGQ